MNSGSDPQRPWEISSRRCEKRGWEAHGKPQHNRGPQTTRRPGFLARPGSFISQGRALRDMMAISAATPQSATCCRPEHLRRGSCACRALILRRRNTLTPCLNQPPVFRAGCGRHAAFRAAVVWISSSADSFQNRLDLRVLVQGRLTHHGREQIAWEEAAIVPQNDSVETRKSSP